MFKLTKPAMRLKGDATFFRSGIRFSSNFIKNEGLEDMNYCLIFIKKPLIGFYFDKVEKGFAIKLTNSSVSTKGKTMSCAYLKQYEWIKKIMEDKDINNRKFIIEPSSTTVYKTDTQFNIEYILNTKQ